VGLLSSLVTWPLAPVRGVVSLGELIQRRVDQELNDPARTRRQLEELDEARRRGEITPEQEHQAQEQILASRISPDAARNTPHKDG
jgi:L-fucose isomerase-like protein